MIGRSQHLHDERLLTCYYAERHGDVPDPPLAEHLADCAACRTRYEGLVRFMDDLRTDADAHVDALFPADRLAAQQAQIARRIDHMGQAARVISFPGHAPEAPAATRPHTTRWVAAAAAAGLFVGLLVGTWSNVAAPIAPLEVAVSQPADAEPVRLRLPMDEETFLRELELARGHQGARALVPLDAFTPSIREITTELR